MTHVVKEIAGVCDLLGLAAAQPRRYPGLLESVARGNARARHDILFAFPGRELRLAGGVVRDERGAACGGRFLDALDDAWRAERGGRDDDGLPFRGGWLLYLGYELAAEIEPSLDLPAPRETALPTALALRCPAAIVVDHERARTLLVAEGGREDLLGVLADDLAAAARFEASPWRRAGIEEDAPQVFLDGVARVHEHLRAGNVFQVNLSRAWRARCAPAPRPADLYAALRRANPAPFAGLLQHGGWAVVSSSPERLVEVRGTHVQTRPIAGTRPRTPGDDDEARMRELAAHPKERAEHVMLIDLERNDLGRICVPGSVEVDELMAIESYAHVHHIVSNVRGELRAGVTPGQVIRAAFPGGTITGCPKVRCMQIIAALEGVGRGAYTGSFGYLDRNGDLDLNILIRTLTLHGDAVSFRAGAGIVADSEAPRELEETRAKARGLLRALDA
ncbi:aminodeoxychorismate synthase component I [Dokdonella fugitiva]|jgi:anthranilate synthase component 1|uniref:Anthranilate synthase component 1 n=1 Tax=Dokdonella fugitiva TaxID=328517 RepID=A0A4R2HUF7_9GAMM|nr:aminodeoxychorismate synthase component I [Dokdonella fugitiva]TCO34972.1 anthranilate synthase component 1 [Dokdonella fugitiva]